jgi:hypothetical protein
MGVFLAQNHQTIGVFLKVQKNYQPPFPNRLGYCAGIWYVIFQAVPRSTPLGRPQHEIPGICCSP